MDWPLIRYYGVRFSGFWAGVTVGLAYAASGLTGTSPGLVALGLIGVASVLLVLTMGTTGASTAAASNQPGQPTMVDPAAAGAGANPPGGVRPFFYAIGLVGWSALLLFAVWIDLA